MFLLLHCYWHELSTLTMSHWSRHKSCWDVNWVKPGRQLRDSRSRTPELPCTSHTSKHWPVTGMWILTTLRDSQPIFIIANWTLLLKSSQLGWTELYLRKGVSRDWNKWLALVLLIKINWGETRDESLVSWALTIAWPHVMICSRYFLRTCF